VRYFDPIEPFVRRLLAVSLLATLVGLIALHFGLVGIGNWAVDEFIVINSYRANGWAVFVDRLITWSPRPISEVLIWAYACLVNWQHKPFIGFFLALLWLTLILAPLISFLQIRKPFSELSRGSILFLYMFAFALIGFFLLGHNPGELFYWPIGAAAYLTTLSAITVCFFQIALSLTESHAGRVITSLSLIFAAGSSETGAFFAVVFGCLSLTGTVVDTVRGSLSQRKIFWSLIPVIVGIGVFGLLVQNRARNQEAALAAAEYHNLHLSLNAALGQTLKEYLVTGQRLSTRGVILGLLLKVCFFLGVRYCWLSTGIRLSRKQVLLVFSLSIVATTYFSIAASYYAYGEATNDRHHELRQCLIILLITIVALFSCHYHVPTFETRRLQWLATIFVFVTLVLVVPQRFSALKHDYRNYSVRVENRRKSWKSGFSDANTMIWYSTPPGRIVKAYVGEPGMYDLESNPPARVTPLMHFFQKQRLEIRPFVEGAR
jgi:hypothetical protein